MSAETTRLLVSRLFEEVVNDWNFAHLDEIFSPDFRPDATDASPVMGPDAAEQFLLWLRSAFPDLQYSIDDIVVEADKAVARLHAEGTHEGEYLGRRGRGARVHFTETMMIRISDGRIAEWWPQADRLSILEQIDQHGA